MKKPILYSFSLCLVLLSCKTRTFQEFTASNELDTSSLLKSYGGGIDFGIPFAPVNETIAKEFWNSYMNQNSYSANVISHAEKDSSFGDYVDSDISSFGESGARKLVHSTANSEIDQLIRAYYNVAQKWFKLGCQQVDMNATLQKQFKIAGPRLQYVRENSAGLEECSFSDINTKAKLDTSLAIAENSTWSPGPGAVSTDPDQNYNFSAGIKQITVEATEANDYVTRKQLGIAVYTPFFVTRGNSVARTPSSGVELIIAGDFIFPAHSWAHSKSFALPVMKFQGDRKKSDFLKPIAFYDFGLLVLNSLPEKGNILASRMGDSLASAWKDQKKRSSTGLLAYKDEFKNRINKYLEPYENVQKNLVEDKNMERAMIGSTHFIINSFWAQRRAGLNNLMAIMDVTRQELIDLYVGDAVSGEAWINTLDRFTETPMGQQEQFKNLIYTKNCKYKENIKGNIPGQFVETEIVIGGEAGRDFIFNKKKIVMISNCDFAVE